MRPPRVATVSSGLEFSAVQMKSVVPGDGLVDIRHGEAINTTRIAFVLYRDCRERISHCKAGLFLDKGWVMGVDVYLGRLL